MRKPEQDFGANKAGQKNTIVRGSSGLFTHAGYTPSALVFAVFRGLVADNLAPATVGAEIRGCGPPTHRYLPSFAGIACPKPVAVFGREAPSCGEGGGWVHLARILTFRTLAQTHPEA